MSRCSSDRNETVGAGAGSVQARRWRLIVDGAGEAAWNMAVDEALLRGVGANGSPPTIRLYRWLHPALTIGRFQKIERTIDLEACRRHAVPVIRRITGGRGILHGTDLTVSIVGTLDDLEVARENASTSAIYRLTADWFVSALQTMGIAAELGQCGKQRGQERVGNCFDIVSRADVVERETGRKLLGSALHRSGDTVLQQVSLPADFGGSAVIDPASEVFPHRATLAANTGGRSGPAAATLAGDRLIASLLAALAQRFEGLQPDGSLTERENAAAAGLVASRYVASEWNEQGITAREPVCN